MEAGGGTKGRLQLWHRRNDGRKHEAATGGNPSVQPTFRPAHGMRGLKGGWAQTQGHLQGQGYMLSSVVNKAIIVLAHVQSILISIIKYNPHHVSESFPRFADETAGAQGTADGWPNITQAVGRQQRKDSDPDRL